MNRTAIVFLSLVFASSAFLVPPADAQVPGTHVVSGQICVQTGWYEEECYAGIPNATVGLAGGVAGVFDESTESDEDGQFVFDDVPEGDYTITVQRTGFEPANKDITVDGDEKVSMPLVGQQVEVAGRLLSDDGDGIAGAYIRAYGDGWAEAESDADGGFSLSLTAGWYGLEIEAPGHGFLSQEMLLDGSDIELTLDAPPGQDALLRGRVVDQDGDPVADADVIIDQWEARTSSGEYHHGNYRNWTTTDADGRYEANVYGGGLSVQFRKEGHAQQYEWLEIEPGATESLDVELLRYPEKTARIEGRVTDGSGTALKHVSVSIQNPEYGIYECSTRARGAQGEPEPMPVSEPASTSIAYDPYYEACAITVEEDGTFSGAVTPGYSIVRIYYDHWASCDETQHADGSFERDCGPDYFPYVETLVLAEDADRRLDIELRQKPGPDAVVSGYVVDDETQTALTDAWISFSNQETYAWGSASTDDDGSYRIRVHSGYHQVSVWAEGYLPWEGMVYLSPDGETPFDVILTPGKGRYGCCYAYAEETAVDHAEGAPASAGSADASMEPSAPQGEAGDGSDYEDLGGGLGPYDPAERAKVHEGSEPGSAIPSPLAFVLLALAAALLISRR